MSPKAEAAARKVAEAWKRLDAAYASGNIANVHFYRIGLRVAARELSEAMNDEGNEVCDGKA